MAAYRFERGSVYAAPAPRAAAPQASVRELDAPPTQPPGPGASWQERMAYIAGLEE